MELLSEYGLFLAKIVTVVLAIAAIAAIIVNVAQRNKRQRGELRVNNLSEQYKEMKEELAAALMDSHQQKQWHKAQKKKHKQEAKAAKAKAKLGEVATDSKPRVWVLDFKGSMDAHEVNSLREEITAVLAAFKPQDQVVLRLESPGGMVHGYGLAASQLQRLRDKNIPLTVTVDKVAASGGYMMACVADKIVSAPFAIVGSIGVVAQMPNFNRFLKSKDIDIELHTAGQYKRTLTLLGRQPVAFYSLYINVGDVFFYWYMPAGYFTAVCLTGYLTGMGYIFLPKFTQTGQQRYAHGEAIVNYLARKEAATHSGRRRKGETRKLDYALLGWAISANLGREWALRIAPSLSSAIRAPEIARNGVLFSLQTHLSCGANTSLLGRSYSGGGAGGGAGGGGGGGW